MNEDKELVLSTLNAISPAELDYTEWLNVGMALKAEGFDVSVWDDWSQDDSRYKRGQCARKWNGFNGSGLTAGTIVKMAKDRGFIVHKEEYLDFDAIIDVDEKPAYFWDRKGDFVTFLKTLFKPEDNLVLNTSSIWTDDDGKKHPGKGTFKNVGEMLERLKTKDLEDVIFDSDPDAGAWITFNPIGGDGSRKNENVTAYRYALVESDTMSISEQENFLVSSNLPIATMVYSGGKSIHALVKVDAKDHMEYRERVAFLYDYLKSKGIEIDEQNKNESRLTRLPGVYRNGKEQKLMAVNIGPKSWEAWKESLSLDNMPGLLNFADYAEQEIKLAPELIEGLLRRGHKGLVAGESKSGKSWALIELGAAVATGTKWLGSFQCKEAGVLYLNLEIDGNSFCFRSQKVWRELLLHTTRNFYVANLRGFAKPLNELLPYIISKAKSIPNLGLIILDPIYKLSLADENNASEMAAFLNQLDKLAEETQSAVVFCHHFAKGGQASKKAIDRASGSGVLARDPDMLAMLTKLESKDDDDGVPIRAEFITREFQEPKPINLWFKYPIHAADINNILSRRGIEGNNLDKSSRKNPETNEDKLLKINNAFETVTKDDKTATKEDMMQELGVKSETTFRAWFKIELVKKEFIYQKGLVVRV